MAARTNDFTISFCNQIYVCEERKCAPQLYGQFLPALGTPALYDLCAARGAHPCQKTMGPFALFIVRTIRCISHDALLV